jgi:peptide chain release factor 2
MINLVNKINQDFHDLKDLIELAESENDSDLIKELNNSLDNLIIKSSKYKIETMFSNQNDFSNCFLEIHAGAGGTEAQDWALMLQRMYFRWAEKKGFKVKIIEESPGEEAGIKSSTLMFTGDYANGWTRTETGVHRLVRISPFDSSSRRHTSFASVWVYPETSEEIDITIDDKDLKIDTYRASGAGGQHVNKTDSAIRITHLPTKIIVQCQSDRSQHRNKAQALSMLKAKLYELELKKREEENELLSSSKNEIGWGSQIRSYVLHPYNLVKDLRTNVETGNTVAVLDGELDQFINEALAKNL